MGELAFVLQGQRLGGRRHCGRLLSAQRDRVVWRSGTIGEAGHQCSTAPFFSGGIPVGFSPISEGPGRHPWLAKILEGFPAAIGFFWRDAKKTNRPRSVRNNKCLPASLMERCDLHAMQRTFNAMTPQVLMPFDSIGVFPVLVHTFQY